MLHTVAPMIVDGLADASMTFFVAVGLTVVFSVLRVLNVMHGSFYSIGAYAAVSVGLWGMSQGLGPHVTYLGLLASAVLVAALLGPLIERTFLRWTYGRPEALQILVTFALFVILEDVQKLVFGVHARYHDTPLQLLGVSVVGGVAFLNYKLLLIGLAGVVVLALRWALRSTRVGKLVVAVVADREMAQAIGVNTNRIFALAFTFGVFIAALGGAISSPTFGVAPGLGAEAIVLAFAVAAIGGLGQIEGAALAATVIGFSRALAIYFAPALDAVVPYLVMLAVLLVRPYGFLGTVQARRV